jgi:hypothetical protein
MAIMPNVTLQLKALAPATYMAAQIHLLSGSRHEMTVQT